MATQLSSLRSKHWHRIEELSEQMYRLAEKNEWVQIQEIETERQKKIREFFAIQVAANEVEDITRLIQKILHDDMSLMQKGLQAKEEVGASLQKLSNNKKAANAYRDHF